MELCTCTEIKISWRETFIRVSKIEIHKQNDNIKKYSEQEITPKYFAIFKKLIVKWRVRSDKGKALG